jgi:hypothetical protein
MRLIAVKAESVEETARFRASLGDQLFAQCFELSSFAAVNSEVRHDGAAVVVSSH